MCFYCSRSDPTSKEWSIIELQGDLRSHAEISFEGQFVGDLHYTKSGTPLLIIGQHLMFGKEVILQRPFALLEKKKHENGGTEYLVKAFITKKLLFRSRPNPIAVN